MNEFAEKDHLYNALIFYWHWLIHGQHVKRTVSSIRHAQGTRPCKEMQLVDALEDEAAPHPSHPSVSFTHTHTERHTWRKTTEKTQKSRAESAVWVQEVVFTVSRRWCLAGRGEIICELMSNLIERCTCYALQSVTHTLQEVLSRERAGVWRLAVLSHRLAAEVTIEICGLEGNTRHHKWLGRTNRCILWTRSLQSNSRACTQANMVSHQPFNLQGEEGGEEEEYPYYRTDDETQPEYPCLCICPGVVTLRRLHTHINNPMLILEKTMLYHTNNYESVLLFWPQTPRGSFHHRRSDSTSAAPPTAGRSHSETGTGGKWVWWSERK